MSPLVPTGQILALAPEGECGHDRRESARREVRETGHHIAFVGEVVFRQHFPRAPLVFHRGRIGTTSPPPGDELPLVANSWSAIP